MKKYIGLFLCFLVLMSTGCVSNKVVNTLTFEDGCIIEISIIDKISVQNSNGIEIQFKNDGNQEVDFIFYSQSVFISLSNNTDYFDVSPISIAELPSFTSIDKKEEFILNSNNSIKILPSETKSVIVPIFNLSTLPKGEASMRLTLTIISKYRDDEILIKEDIRLV